MAWLLYRKWDFSNPNIQSILLKLKWNKTYFKTAVLRDISIHRPCFDVGFVLAFFLLLWRVLESSPMSEFIMALNIIFLSRCSHHFKLCWKTEKLSGQGTLRMWRRHVRRAWGACFCGGQRCFLTAPGMASLRCRLAPLPLVRADLTALWDLTLLYFTHFHHFILWVPSRRRCQWLILWMVLAMLRCYRGQPTYSLGLDRKSAGGSGKAWFWAVSSAQLATWPWTQQRTDELPRKFALLVVDKIILKLYAGG